MCYSLQTEENIYQNIYVNVYFFGIALISRFKTKV